MKTLFVLSAIPGFVVAGQISGQVVDLLGNPVAGVVVESRQESAISKPSGSWILGEQANRAPGSAHSKQFPSSLILDHGRLRIQGSARGVDGRLGQARGQERSETGASRAMRAAQAETLWVYWKGKRLAELPVESRDTSGIAIRIDTAWGDDGGIPWNPKVQYGSLQDARDGNVYRTVKIGGRTWMAEGLRLQEDYSPYFYENRGSQWVPNYSQEIWNRLELPLSSDSLAKNRWGTLFARKSFDSTSVHSICPEGWRVPSLRDVFGIASRLEDQVDTGSSLEVFLRDSLKLTGAALRSTGGWPSGLAGQDDIGFRLVPTGFTITNEVTKNSGMPLVKGRETPARVGGFWVSDSWSGLEFLDLGLTGGYVFESGRPDGESGPPNGRIVRKGILSRQAAPVRCLKGGD